MKCMTSSTGECLQQKTKRDSQKHTYPLAHYLVYIFRKSVCCFSGLSMGSGHRGGASSEEEEQQLSREKMLFRGGPPQE